MLRCKSLKIAEIEINGVKLSNTFEILQYIGKQEERIAELEAQIEKMKLCANCKHCGVSGWCNKLKRYLLDKANQSCGNWEIKENG